MSQRDDFSTTLREWIKLFMHQSMHGYIRYVRERGLSMSVIGTLHHLRKEDPVGVSDLGEHLGVSSAAASQMLDRLVAEGLISRAEDPEDRRMKRISLTDHGRLILDESVDARLSWLQDLETRLTEDELERITAALRLMIEKARQG